MISPPLSLRLRPIKLALKSRWVALRNGFVQRFMSYDAAQLLGVLRELGVRDADSLMLHSASGAQYGFRGSIDDLTRVFIDAVGAQGHLLMVSLPYRSSSIQYLENLKQFDVRRTPSMMGMVSEYFRRRPEVLRSLSPTHPMLVRGPRAAWYVADHEDCLYPCGPGTPFEKFLNENGIVVFFNVPVGTLTFFHHLEHLVGADLPFELYTQPAHRVTVVDREGRESTMSVHAYTMETIRRRRFPVLEAALRERGMVAHRRIGNTHLWAVRVRDAIACTEEMRRAGRYFYDLPPAAPGAPARSLEGARIRASDPSGDAARGNG